MKKHLKITVTAVLLAVIFALSVFAPAAVPDDGSTKTAGDQTVNVISYSQINDSVTPFLRNVEYDPSDYDVSLVGMYIYQATDFREDRPKGISLTFPQKGRLTVFSGDGKITYDVDQGSVYVDSLVPKTKSLYFFSDENGTPVSSGIITAEGSVRMINGGGNTVNIRDIGGWNCDGGSLRYGKVIRGCELNGENGISISEEQRKYFVDFLSVDDEIDLRAKTELDGPDGIYNTEDDISGSVFGSDTGYFWRSLKAYGADNDMQRERYADIFRRLAEDMQSGKTCYIHCAAGADRTGTICALIEAICGVSQSDIDKDYEVTSFSAHERTRNSDSWKSFISLINAMPGKTFRDRAVEYLLDLGVTMGEINTIRQNMIDGNVTDLPQENDPDPDDRHNDTESTADRAERAADYLLENLSDPDMTSPRVIRSQLQALNLSFKDVYEALFFRCKDDFETYYEASEKLCFADASVKGDVNSDGFIDVLDALWIQKFAAEKIVSFDQCAQ